MVYFVYQKFCRLWKLTDELVAGIPALAPTTLPDGSLQANVVVSGNPTSTTVAVPDASLQPQVDAIVAAHDPTTPDAQETAQNQRVANLATLDQRAQTALSNNATYLAITSPTNAQVVAQVKALTRQINGLIRVTLSLLDSIADS